MAKEIVFQINTDTSQSVKNLEQLEEAINSLKEELKTAEFGSDEFKRLSGQLQNAQSEVKKFEKTFEGLEPEKKVEAFAKVGEALAGGFAAATGTLALFGEESEAVNKLAEKSQQAVAVALGLRAVAEGAVQASIAKRLVTEALSNAGTKVAIATQAAFNLVVGVGSNAMKLFRVALASTGIGALVVGLGLLISNFDKVVSFAKSIVNRFETLKILVGALTDAWTYLSEAVGLADTAEEKAAARAEIRKKNSDMRVKQIEREIALLEAQGATEEEIYNKQVKIYRDRIKAETDLYNTKRATGEATREEFEALQDLGNEYAVFIATRTKKLQEEKEKEIQAQKEKNAKLKEEQTKYLQDISKQLEDARIANISDAAEREIKAEEIALQRKFAAIKGNSEKENQLRAELQKSSDEKIKGIRAEALKATTEKEREEALKKQEQFYKDAIANIDATILAGKEGSVALLDAQKEQALLIRNQSLAQEGLTRGEQLKINEEYNARIRELNKAQVDFEQALAIQKRDAVISAAQNTLSALNVIAELANKNGEKQSAAQKALAIAGLAVNTAVSIGNTIAGATAAAAAGGPAAPFLLAGYIASGLATVLANFASAKKLLGGASGASSASSGLNGGGVQPPSPSNITTSPSTNLENKTESINVKAYVVESDMTSAQQSAQKTKQLATI